MKEQQFQITDSDVTRLSSVFRSLGKVKLKVLLYLYFRPYKTHREIRDRFGYHGDTIRNVLLGASRQGIVEKVNGKYKLTTPGKRLVEGAVELIAAMKEEG